MESFGQKKMNFKFGAKIALFRYSRTEFEKRIFIYEMSNLEFVKMQSFMQHEKDFELELRMPY